MLVKFLHQDGDKRIWLNSEHVVSIRESGSGGSVVETSNGSHHFLKDPPDVVERSLWVEE